MEAEGEVPPQTVGIVQCVEPSRLVVDMPSPDGLWHLDVSLSVEGNATTLVFVQPLEEPYDASSIGPGWHYYLDRLEAVVEGRPVPQEWDDYYPALQEAYQLPKS